MQDKKKLPEKLGLKETSSGSGVFTCPGDPDGFWKNLTKITRKKGKEIRG